MRYPLLFLTCLSALLGAQGLQAADLPASVAARKAKLLALYEKLHANPELSMQEVKTAALLATEMQALGFKVTEKVGKTGLVAVMENGPGPTLLIRTDMDGLPVAEQTGLAFASTAKGTALDGRESPVMHACGHDTHMSGWIGTAHEMAARKTAWRGTLVMIAQPGEETGTGARSMIADGLFTRFPKPDFALAFHDSASLPAGVIGYSSGYTYANVDSVDVLVRGVGGHGAYPHQTKDPILLAARIVEALQSLVSREMDPQHSGVVTVGSFHAGTKHNIIPDEARLQLTVRSYSDADRALLLNGIARIAKGEALAAGLPEDRMPVITVRDEATPATFNTEPLTARMASLFEKHFGHARVTTLAPTMAGEDFGRYRREDPGMQSLIFWVGGVPAAQWQKSAGDPAKLPSLHSPFWAPDAATVILTATEAMTVAALDILAPGTSR